ncbi:MAG: hypothetical protein KGL39_32845 [Patescibacteria group bacterium]|nr:hypothetical protein [Patescibacteria group bacterium]
MTPETVTAIQTVLAPVAEKIGQGAQFGWETVVRQQYVEATEGALDAIGFTIALVVIIVVALKLWKKLDDSCDGEIGQTLLIVLGGLAAFLMLCGVVDGIETAITHLLNPDYYALQFFIGLVK